MCFCKSWKLLYRNLCLFFKSKTVQSILPFQSLLRSVQNIASKVYFCGGFLIIFISGQMEPGTVDFLTFKILKVANCINRKSTEMFSFESFQTQKLKGEEHRDCKEKPKDKVLKIFCSLVYFLKWILFSDLFWVGPCICCHSCAN